MLERQKAHSTGYLGKRNHDKEKKNNQVANENYLI
jgi:hypothetical protein